MNPFYHNHSNGKNGLSEYVLTLFGIIASFIIGSFVSALAAQVIGVDLFESGEGVNSVLKLIFALLPFGFPVLFLWISYRNIHHLKPLSLFTSRDKFDWSRFNFIFLIWFVLNSLLLGISFIAGEDIKWNFQWDVFLPLLIVAVLLIPIQTLAEELVFRTYLFQAMGRIGIAPIISVVFIAVLFAMMHGSNPEVQKFGNLMFVFYVLNGLFLGLITALDNGIELSFGFHAANNLFGVLIVSFESSALSTESLFIQHEEQLSVWSTILTFLVSSIIVVLVLKRKYNWNFVNLLKR